MSVLTTRREWVQAACGAAWLPWSAGAGAAPSSDLQVDQLLRRYPAAGSRIETRSYRVDAALTVLSSPLHWFRGIGHGFLTLGETARAEDGSKALFMRFGAATNVEKAHGFDRLGFIEEAVAEHSREFANFGFITAGHESNRAAAGAAFTAMDLYASGARCWFRRAGVPGVGGHTLDERLIGHVRGRLPLSGVEPVTVPFAEPRATFLYSLLQAIESPADRFRCTYVYNAKQFDFDIIRRTENPRSTFRYDGAICDGPGQSAELGLGARRQWSFSFWTDSRSKLPRRIVFQPKAMLRLSLEFE
jgi:hypothetical protein